MEDSAVSLNPADIPVVIRLLGSIERWILAAQAVQKLRSNHYFRHGCTGSSIPWPIRCEMEPKRFDETEIHPAHLPKNDAVPEVPTGLPAIGPDGLCSHGQHPILCDLCTLELLVKRHLKTR